MAYAEQRGYGQVPLQQQPQVAYREPRRVVNSSYSLLAATFAFLFLTFLMAIATLAIVGVLLQRSDDGTLDDGGITVDNTNANILSDLRNFQSALAVERLLVAAYGAVLTSYPVPTAITTAGSTFTAAYVLAILTQFQTAETARAAYLASTITTQCATLPVNMQAQCVAGVACTYSFAGAYSTQATAIAFLATLEGDAQTLLIDLVPSFTNNLNALSLGGLLAAESEQAATLNVFGDASPIPTVTPYIVASTPSRTVLCNLIADTYITTSATCAPWSTTTCP
jgi:hypothetical protein